MCLELEERSGQTDGYQQELQPGVHFRDGGRLDGGGGQRGVEVLLESEGRHDTHVPDVEASVDQEEVPGHDEAGEGGGDEVGVGEGEVGRACDEDRNTKPSSPSSLPTRILSESGSRKEPRLEAWFLKFRAMYPSRKSVAPA